MEEVIEIAFVVRSVILIFVLEELLHEPTL
jgi:hypothetical protein